MADKRGRTTFIFSTQTTDFRRDAVYENPRYFEKLPPQGLKQYDNIIVVGNWPVVQAALDAANLSWSAGDKGDYEGSGDDTKSNTGLVRGAPTGSSQGAVMRQKEGTIVTDLAKNGPVNEGEGDPAQASVQSTGDGEETVAREQGVKTEDIMSGTQQVALAPGQPHPPLANAGKPEQRSLDDIRANDPNNTQQDKVPYPIAKDWEDLAWPEQKALASRFTDDPVTSKAIASKVIKAELAKRA